MIQVLCSIWYTQLLIQYTLMHSEHIYINVFSIIHCKKLGMQEMNSIASFIHLLNELIVIVLWNIES
jgi:hypothetical protein